jgi:hypothetical protein
MLGNLALVAQFTLTTQFTVILDLLNKRSTYKGRGAFKLRYSFHRPLCGGFTTDYGGDFNTMGPRFLETELQIAHLETHRGGNKETLALMELPPIRISQYQLVVGPTL